MARLSTGLRKQLEKLFLFRALKISIPKTCIKKRVGEIQKQVKTRSQEKKL